MIIVLIRNLPVANCVKIQWYSKSPNKDILHILRKKDIYGIGETLKGEKHEKHQKQRKTPENTGKHF